MEFQRQLIPGAFYWVIPEVDSDAEYRDEWEPGQEWQDEIQPARFTSRSYRLPCVD